MARTRQKLINYHSSGKTEITQEILDNLNYGEIAVRHAADQPELIIKTGPSTKAVFIDSNAIDSKIDASQISITGQLEVIDERLDTIESGYAQSAIVDTLVSGAKDSVYSSAVSYTNGQISTISGTILDTVASAYTTKDEFDTLNNTVTGHTSELQSVDERLDTIESGYAQSAVVNTLVSGAKDSVYSSAVSYTDGAISDALDTVANTYVTNTEFNNLNDVVTGHTSELQSVDTRLDTIESGYAQSAIVDTLVSGAKDSVYSSAVSYTNGQISTISGTILDTVASAYTTKDEFDTLNNTVTSHTSELQSVDTRLDTIESGYAQSAIVNTLINTKISNVYKFKGSVNTYDDLSSITTKENGDVYNVISGNGTTPPGTNYAYVEASGTTPAHWDALGGSIDLSIYVTDDEFNTLSNTVTAHTSAIASADTRLSTIESGYAQSAIVDTLVSGAKDSVYSSAVSYTDGAISDALDTVSDNYVTNTEFNNLNDVVTGHTSAIASADTRLSTIESGYAQSAIVDTLVSGAKDSVYSSAVSYTDGAISDALDTVANNYVTNTEFNNLNDVVTGHTSELQSVDERLDTIESGYAQSAIVDTLVSGAKDSVYSSAVSYTDGAISDALDTVSETYVTNTEFNNLNDVVTAHTSAIASADTRLTAVENIANSALQGFQLSGTSASTVSGNETTQYGAVANFTSGGNATLDLSGLVIDCGDF